MERFKVILFIQLNVSANYIRNLITNMFKKLVIPLSEEFDIPSTLDPKSPKMTVLIHHLAVDADANRIQRVKSPAIIWSSPERSELLSGATKLQIVQPVKVYIESLEALKEKGPEKIESFTRAPTINVKLDVTAFPSGSTLGFVLPPDKPEKGHPDVRICVSFSEIEFPIGLNLDDKNRERFISLVRENFKDVCKDIHIRSIIKSIGDDPALKPALKSLTDLIGENPDVANAAASGSGSSEAVETVAFRIEIRGGMELSTSSWKPFYSGDIASALDLFDSPEVLSKTDWSVFIDRTTLLAVFSGIIRDVLKGSTEFELKSGLDGEWHDYWPAYDEDGKIFWSEGRAIATIKFNGELHSKGCDIDVEPVSFFFELLMNETNVLQVFGHISWDLVDSDVITCGLKKGVEINLPTLLLGIFAGPFAGPFGMAVFNPFGFVIILFGAIYLASTKKPPIAERPKCTFSEDKTSMSCDYPITPIDNKDFGRIDATSVRGLSTGLLLGGKITPPRDITPSLLEIAEVLPFEWRYENPCIKKVKLMVYAYIDYREGPYVKVHDISVRNDPVGQFRPYVETDLTGYSGDHLISNGEIKIPRAELKPEYLAAPYPCEILIKSNAGAYWITLDPIPVLTREIEAELEKNLPGMRKLCTLPYDDPFRHGFEITPIGPSDGPDWFGVHRDRLTGVPENYNIWKIFARKLKPGEHIEMRASNRILAKGIADSSGFAEMSMFAPLQSNETMFSLHALVNGEETQPMHKATNIVRSVDTRAQNETINETQALTIMRVQLLQRSRLEIDDKYIDLDAGLFERYPALFVLTRYSLSVYDVSIPSYPRCSYRLPAAGLHSIVMWKGMLITADSQGLALPLNRQRSETRIFEDSGVRALEAGQEYLYVLKDDDRIDVLSRNLERIHSLQIGSGMPIFDIAATSHLLAVSRGDRIYVYNMENPNQTAPASTYAISGAMKISRAKLSSSNNSFYLHNPNGGGRIVDFSEGNGTVTADYYYEDPWFVDSVRVGNVFARLSLNSSQLELYNIAGTKIR